MAGQVAFRFRASVSFSGNPEGISFKHFIGAFSWFPMPVNNSLKDYCHVFFIDEKTGHKRLGNVPQVTHLVCSRAGIIQHCIFWPFNEMQNQFASFQQTLRNGAGNSPVHYDMQCR